MSSVFIVQDINRAITVSRMRNGHTVDNSLFFKISKEDATQKMGIVPYTPKLHTMTVFVINCSIKKGYNPSSSL